MAYKIVESLAAQRDLDHILGYLAGDLGSSKASSDFFTKVKSCYSNLKRTPMMYEFCHKKRLRLLEYRKAVIKNYIMIYKVDAEAKVVLVLRFFHGRQNYERLL